MNTPKHPQKRAQPCTRSFAGVAVDLALAIPIIIARPFADTVAHRGMGWMTAAVALPFVCVQLRAVSRNVLGDERLARSACPRGHPPKTAARPSLAR